MKRYFEIHVQRSPSGSDKHLLPSSFSLRKMHSDFCSKYKDSNNITQESKDPLCWKSF